MFESGQLQKFVCCESSFFKGYVQDIDNKTSVILGCTNLINLVLENDIQEIYADALVKLIPRNMGYQLFTLHCMINNYVRVFYNNL